MVVQGSGNVGGIGAELMHEKGYKIVAISDVGGGIYNANGLDIPDVLEYLKNNKNTRRLSGRRACRTKLFWRSSVTYLPRVRRRTRSHRRTPTGSSARSSPKEPTARRRQRRIRYCTTRGYS